VALDLQLGNDIFLMLSPQGIDFATKNAISDFIQESSSSRRTDASSVIFRDKKTPDKNHFKKRVLSIDETPRSNKKRNRYLNHDSL
jgi:hypothetical protein